MLAFDQDHWQYPAKSETTVITPLAISSLIYAYGSVFQVRLSLANKEMVRTRGRLSARELFETHNSRNFGLHCIAQVGLWELGFKLAYGLWTNQQLARTRHFRR